MPQELTRRRLLRGGALGAGVLGASLWVGPLDAVLRTPTSAASAGPLPEVTSQRLQGLATEIVEGAVRRSARTSTSAPFSMVGFDGPPGAEIRVRTSVDGTAWTDWVIAPARQSDEEPDPGDEESDDGTDGVTEPVWVSEANHIQVEVEGAAPEDIDAHLIDSMGLAESASAEDAAARMAAAVGLGAGAGPSSAQAATSRPPLVFRGGWGANESWRSGSPRYSSTLRFGVVHHTVTGNGYSRGEAPGVVRGIYHYHANVRNWADIGYNFLVDRFGTIYEGRAGGVERPVVGAHAGGFNANSVGVALIGTFTSVDVPEAAQASLARVLAWKFGLHGIDPHGSVTVTSAGSTRYSSGTRVTLRTIIGHRDVSATTCPGNGSYRHIESLRGRIDNELVPALPDPLARIGGRDGIATAVLLSQAAFGDAGSADRAVIATNGVFADAAAGGPLAGRAGPVLLSRRDRLDDNVRAELERVLPAGRPIYLLGGEQALGPAVEDTLADRWEVRRLAGANRAETAALVARQVVGEHGRDVALIAREGPDDAWADSLTAGAYGARHAAPVLLTASNRLSEATRDAIRDLGISRCVVIGGASAVSDAVLQELPNASRQAGDNRAATAVAIAEELWGVTSASDRGGGVVVAAGYSDTAWRDALAAAPLAARRDLPVVLSLPSRLPQETSDYLSGFGGGSSRSVVIGGTAAVQDDPARSAAALLG